MTEQETLHYVKTMAHAIDLLLDETQAQRVAENLQRTFDIVKDLKAQPMLPEHELVEIYCPAVWPGDEESAR